MYLHVWAFSLSQYVHVYCVRNAYTDTCKVMCEVCTTYGHKIVIFTLIKKNSYEE